MVLMRAVYTDLKSDHIENRLIICGLVAGMVFRVLADGWKGLPGSLAVTGIVLFALGILYVLRSIGAGDVKLFCVTTMFFPDKAISLIVSAFLIGGILAVGKLVTHYKEIRKAGVQNTIHFSIPIALGTAIVVLGG